VSSLTPQESCAGRRLHDDALAGAENMARDEALLMERKAPTLRFYSWLRPTVSLGYFQAAADLPLEDLRTQGFDIVRRSTGGKAILHQHELTYSLCLPESGAMAGGPESAMTNIHQALATELERQGRAAGAKDESGGTSGENQAGGTISMRADSILLSDSSGSAWCFEDSSPLDLILEDRKLLGSAARRKNGWVLFHGSLVLQRPDANPGIAELGFTPNTDGLTTALGDALNYRFEDGLWSPSELEQAALIRQSKYADESFTLMR
jgi:lipoate-protein ligase A